MSVYSNLGKTFKKDRHGL